MTKQIIKGLEIIKSILDNHAFFPEIIFKLSGVYKMNVFLQDFIICRLCQLNFFLQLFLIFNGVALNEIIHTSSYDYFASHVNTCNLLFEK